jgi:dihydrodipicolinate synthase/N-acetylneuraminate lyase
MTTDLRGTANRMQLAALYRATLLDDVMPFWLRHGLDCEHGGIFTALVTGPRGFVGSTYNFAAPLYHSLMAAFENCEIESARLCQHRSTCLIALLARHGYMGAAKFTMGMLGVQVGPARLANTSLDATQVKSLRGERETLGFFEWVK